MAKIQDGAGGSYAGVDPTFLALRTSQRPAEALGYYKVATVTGSVTGVGVVANGPLFSMRWTDAAKVAAVWGIRIAAIETTAFAAAQEVSVAATIARSFSASDSGGSAVSLSGNNAKKRTAMSTSVMGDMRVASTTILTAGTRTLDSQDVFTAVGWAGGTGIVIDPQQWQIDNGSGLVHPIVLAQNEGIILRNKVAFAATGVIKFYFEVDWSEHSTYPY